MQLSRHRPAVGDGAGVGEPVELPETGLGVHSRLRPSSPQLPADAEGVGVATGADELDGAPEEVVEEEVVVLVFAVGEALAVGAGVEQPRRPSTHRLPVSGAATRTWWCTGAGLAGTAGAAGAGWPRVTTPEGIATSLVPGWQSAGG